VLTRIAASGVPVPDLDVVFDATEIILYYTAGAHWTADGLGALFDIFRAIHRVAPDVVLRIDEWFYPEERAQFSAAVMQYCVPDLSVLKSYEIEENLWTAGHGSVEVTVTLADGQRRWCLFMTPDTLAASGTAIDGTGARVLFPELHVITVSELSATVIERVLRKIEEGEELLRRTLPRGAARRRGRRAG
jgi:hypothetical protein